MFQEYVDAVEQCQERVERLTEQIRILVPQWRLAPAVEAFQAMRGVSLIVAVTMAAEVGDLSRFDHPRQLMAYLGLVPSEHSSGGPVPARLHHQDRQRPCAPGAGGGGVEPTASRPG